MYSSESFDNTTEHWGKFKVLATFDVGLAAFDVGLAAFDVGLAAFGVDLAAFGVDLATFGFGFGLATFDADLITFAAVLRRGDLLRKSYAVLLFKKNEFTTSNKNRKHKKFIWKNKYLQRVSGFVIVVWIDLKM